MIFTYHVIVCLQLVSLDDLNENPLSCIHLQLWQSVTLQKLSAKCIVLIQIVTFSEESVLYKLVSCFTIDARHVDSVRRNTAVIDDSVRTRCESTIRSFACNCIQSIDVLVSIKA